MANLISELQVIWRGVADDLGAFAIRVVEALLVATLAIIVARWARIRIHQLSRTSRVDANTAALLANISTIAIYLLAVVFNFTLLGGNVALSATILGAATVAISLAMQDVLRSIVAGIYLLAERPFALGERIEIKTASGSVESIHLRTTTLHSQDGTVYRVPNSTIFSEIVANLSYGVAERSIVTVSNLPLTKHHSAEDIARTIESVPGVRGPVRFDRYAADGEQMAMTFSVPLDAGRETPASIIERLHTRWPEAHVTVERGNGA